MEKDILGEREPGNDTDNFFRSSLEGAAVNWMMKCDWQGGITYKFI